MTTAYDKFRRLQHWRSSATGRARIWLCAALLWLVIGGGAMADEVDLDEVLREFELKSIPHMSTRILQNERLACSFGDQPKIHAEVKARGGGHILSPVDVFCTAVLEETVKRGHQSDLFSMMQPGQASAEIQHVIAAASNNQTMYDNADGEAKILNCELAFDAGYMWASQNSGAEIEPSVTPEQIDAVTVDCFNPDTATATYNGLVAGIRQVLRLDR